LVLDIGTGSGGPGDRRAEAVVPRERSASTAMSDAIQAAQENVAANGEAGRVRLVVAICARPPSR